MKRFITRISLGTMIFALVGCGMSTTHPMPAGDNTYVLSSKEGAFPLGNQPLMETTLATANQHCLNQNRVLRLINTHQSPGPYILGNYPKVTITYSCNRK